MTTTVTTTVKAKRTICDRCLRALGCPDPVVGPDTSPFIIVNLEDGTLGFYERVPDDCDWCEQLRLHGKEKVSGSV